MKFNWKILFLPLTIPVDIAAVVLSGGTKDTGLTDWAFDRFKGESERELNWYEKGHGSDADVRKGKR